MADSIGIKLGVEGEKEFKKALADINQNMKVLGSELKAVTSEFEKNDSSLEKFTAQQDVYNKQIDEQKNKVAELQKALENSANSFGEADKRTQNWQIQLNNATAALNEMERTAQGNSDKIRDIGRGFDDAGNKVDEFGNVVEESADDVKTADSAFSELGTTVKAVGAAMAAAFAAVSAAAIAGTKALADMSVETAAFADEILTQSTVTGMTTEALQEYSYAADLVDVSLETLTGSMAKNIKSMTSYEQGSANIVEAYDKLSIAVLDSSGKMRDGEAVYWETIDALKGVADETERDALAMQIFGKSAQDLNPLIAQGSAGIKELADEAHEMGAVMSDSSLAMAGQFDDTIQRITQGSETAKRSLGMVFMPQLNALGTEGVDLLADFANGLNAADGDWEKISETIGNTVKGIANAVLKEMPKILDTGLSIVGAIGSAILDNLPKLVQTASKIGQTILSGLVSALPQITTGAVTLIGTLATRITDNLPTIINSGMAMITSLVQGLAEALPTLIPEAVLAVTTIAQGLIDNLPMLLDAGLQLILGLAEGILTAIPQLIAQLPSLITSIIDFLIKSIPQIIETGVKLLSALVENLPVIITAIVKAIPDIITGIIDAVIKAIPMIISAGITLFTALITNMPEIVKQIVLAVPQIIEGLVKGLMGGLKQIGEVGKNLVMGLWDGIKNMGTWIAEKLASFGEGVMDAIKDFFGIASPSKKFMEIGGFLGEGLGEGFEDEMKSVTKDMEKAIPTEFDTPKFDPKGFQFDPPNFNVDFSGFDRQIKSAANVALTTSVFGNPQAGAAAGQNLTINIPVKLNDKVIAQAVTNVQVRNNTAYTRNRGVVI
jgi:phage-related protein